MGVGYAAALLGGLASLLSPCAAMLLPAFFAYAFTSRTTLLARTGLFTLGLLTTLVPLGAAAGGAGGLLAAHRGTFVTVVSALVVTLGVLQAAGVSWRMPGASRSRADSASPVSVYLLGTAYGLAGVCSGPILGSIVAVAALGGDALYGALLLAVYALGMALPVLLLAWLWQRFDLGRAAWLRPRPVRLGPFATTWGNLLSGGLFVAVGLVLLLTDGTAAAPAALGVQAQQAVEVAIGRAAARVPDLAVVAGAAVAVAAALVWRRRSARVDGVIGRRGDAIDAGASGRRSR